MSGAWVEGRAQMGGGAGEHEIRMILLLLFGYPVARSPPSSSSFALSHVCLDSSDVETQLLAISDSRLAYETACNILLSPLVATVPV